MPNKLQEYRAMAEQAQRQLTGSLERWQSFLTTAARLYKYPYNEQVMIHAQRPDATACAEYDVWNDTMQRYVRRGSKGIALIDTSGYRDRLRYVSDVSDTGTRPNSRNLNLWELHDEHMDVVTAMLERNYGFPSEGNIRGQLEAIATQLAVDYWNDNKRDILDILADSFLEEYDEFNIGVAFRNAAEVSITYSLLSRCGLDPDDYFEHEDFMSVFDFNTPATAGALGTAVSGINQQMTLDMLFPTEQEQISRIDEADRTQTVQSAFSVSQAEVDDILRYGSNTVHARQHIADAFMKQKSIAEIAAMMQREFHGDFGIKGEQGDYAAWVDLDGIHIHKDRDARYHSDSQVISWEDAAKRIGELLDVGSFASNVELAEADCQVREELAQSLLYLYHDRSDLGQSYLLCLNGLPAGYPAAIAEFAEKMTDLEFQKTLQAEFASFGLDYGEDASILRFHYHRVDLLWNGVNDLSRERREYATDLAEMPGVQGFITEDEINQALAGGSSFEGGRGRIYGYFMEDHTPKEQADFLKKEYGTGGRSHALSGATFSSQDYDAKGIKFKKVGCADMEMNWSKVAARISTLIQRERYFTLEEKKKYDQLHQTPEAEDQALAAETIIKME